MNSDLAIWHQALPDCEVSFERRPDGSYVATIRAKEGTFHRVLSSDLKDADQVICRLKMDLMLAKGQSPTPEVIGAIHTSRLPTYTNGCLYKSRASSLWERRRLKSRSVPS